MTIGLIGNNPNQHVNASNGINTSPFSTPAYSNINGASSISNPFLLNREISTNASQGHDIFGNSRVTSEDTYAPAQSAIMPSVSLAAPVAFPPAIQQSQAYTASMPIPQSQQLSGEIKNPSIDVASFKRPLTTSSGTNPCPGGVNNIDPISWDWKQSAPRDSRSNVDASLTSKPPITEPLRKDRLEKPQTSSERTVSEGEDELGLLHTVVRAERNPQALVLSAQKYDKSIAARIPRKGSVPDLPASLASSRNNSIKPDHSSVINIPGEQRRPSDLNKPLPLPPDLVNLDEPEERIVFNERVFAGSPDEKKILSSPVKTVTKPSLGCRSSSQKSSLDRPIGELYKSLRGPKPSDELFNNLSPHVGMEATPEAPSTPPSRKTNNSGSAKLTSSFSTMHIVDQCNSPRNHESSKYDNPFNISLSHQDISSHPLKTSPSLSSLSPSGRNARRLLSSPISTIACMPSSPASASTSTTTSPSTTATSIAHSPEIGTPITPATKFPIPTASSSSTSSLSSAKTAKPPPIPPPRRSSSSRKNSDLEAQITLMQAKRAGTDPIPQIPQFQVQTHRSPSHSSHSPLTSLAQP